LGVLQPTKNTKLSSGLTGLQIKIKEESKEDRMKTMVKEYKVKESTNEFLCKNCGETLFTIKDTVHNGVSGPNKFSLCSGIFVKYMNWMGNELNKGGKITCPNT
jgi:uncharacterized protein with PIN domain